MSKCVVNTIGDVIIFTVERDIAKNEEITIIQRYFPTEWSWSDKLERGMDIYGFKCDCALCKLDEKDPMRMMRSQLLMQVDAKASDKKKSLNDILKYVEKIRETYVKRRNCLIELIHAMD